MIFYRNDRNIFYMACNIDSDYCVIYPKEYVVSGVAPEDMFTFRF